ncbi:spermatogenesis-associated protein 17-like [Battus philenor]|uniref:spermatogenesis-associated protein 17-like n=1 Tax=Battus philenor TaxID=42288 RepID=UPI0035CF3EDC
MATVYELLPNEYNYYQELYIRSKLAEAQRHQRFTAVVLLQRVARGYLIRKHVAWLSKNALTIQCAFRQHLSRKAYRRALIEAVRNKHNKRYNQAATKIQALWRGHFSRQTKFDYYSYRRWLKIVTERGERKAAVAVEFGIRTKVDDLKMLEEEARKWLAFVVFKLHHLLRTYVCGGIYSKLGTSELSEFENLLKSIHYTEYMKRLKNKYDEFVRKYRPRFSNKRLFPIIGNGSDYWYLSLPEMYQLTAEAPKVKDTRHSMTHHGPQHKKPFLWRKLSSALFQEDRGPFVTKKVASKEVVRKSTDIRKDPRFNLYVQHYTPQPNIFDYVDYHINAVLVRKHSIQNISYDNFS